MKKLQQRIAKGQDLWWKKWNKKPPENGGSCLLEMAPHTKISPRLLEKIPWGIKQPWPGPRLASEPPPKWRNSRGPNFRLPLPQPPEWFQLWNFAHCWVIWHTHQQPKLCPTLTLATSFPHSSYSLGGSQGQQEFCHMVRDYCGKGLEAQATTGIFLALPGWEQHVVCCCKAWTSHPAGHQGQIPADPTRRESQNSGQLSWAAAGVILHDGDKLFWADLYILSAFKYIKWSFDSYFQC